MSHDFTLSDFFPYQLAVLSERMSRRLSVDYEGSHGISVAEWRVLVHLQRCVTASVREIQDYTNLEKSRISRAVTRLVDAGLVTKLPGKEDARLVEISLSDKGHAVLAEILPRATEIEAQALADVSAQEMNAFRKVMEQIHQSLDRDPKAKPRSSLDKR